MMYLRNIVAGFFLLIVFSCGNADQNNGNSDVTAAAGPVEILEVSPIKADEVSDLIASYANKKAVLVNVWATWCIPCVEEFPHIAKVQKEFPEDLQVVFISADFPEEIDRIHDFLRTNAVDWQTYLKDDRDEPFINAVWPEWSGAIPASVIYNKNGTNLTFFERSATYEEFKELTQQAINNNQ